MTILYAMAQSRGYLVAGTGNASEAYVGYFTKWGDGAHDFNPIGDLTKEEVVELGRELGLPSECIERVPSAGLWEGQTDEGEMGFKYTEINEVMKYGELSVARGTVSRENYEKIMKMHKVSEHKRNLIPTFKECC
jgi:NAD+ synthase